MCRISAATTSPDSNKMRSVLGLSSTHSAKPWENCKTRPASATPSGRQSHGRSRFAHAASTQILYHTKSPSAKLESKVSSPENPVRVPRSKSLTTIKPASQSESLSKMRRRPEGPTSMGQCKADCAFPKSPCMKRVTAPHSDEVCNAILHTPVAAPKIRRLTDIFEKVCADDLLRNDTLNLGNLRLYFKGLTVTPEQINLRNLETKWTFLHHFAYQGDVDLVEWSLQVGADHAAVTALGKTPLHLAAENNQSAAVMALLRGGADPNAKTLAGYTCLHLAVLNGHKHMVATLLQNSIAPLDIEEDSSRGTALEMARDPTIRGMLKEFSANGFLKNSGEIMRSKSARILLQPLSLSNFRDEC